MNKLHEQPLTRFIEHTHFGGQFFFRFEDFRILKQSGETLAHFFPKPVKVVLSARDREREKEYVLEGEDRFQTQRVRRDSFPFVTLHDLLDVFFMISRLDRGATTWRERKVEL